MGEKRVMGGVRVSCVACVLCVVCCVRGLFLD